MRTKPMPKTYDLNDLQNEARRLSGDSKTLVFCDDEGYGLIVPQHFPMVFLGATPHKAMRRLRHLFRPKQPRTSQAAIDGPYTAEMFTSIRMHLMLARNEILAVGAAHRDHCDSPRDVLNIFSSLCSADNEVIKAQKARGLDDSAILGQVRQLALKSRRQK